MERVIKESARRRRRRDNGLGRGFEIQPSDGDGEVG